MFCNQKYHSSKATPWKVNAHFIEESGIDVDLTLVKKTQAAMEAMITNNQKKKGSRRHHSNASDNSNDNDISQNQNVSRDLSNNHGGSPYTASTNSDTVRRSQRKKEAANACNAREA